jgi:perosamine synthetase
MTEKQRELIPLCVPEIRGNEWQYIRECLDTNWVSSVGSYVDRFETAVAKYTGSRHAVATINGTAALHLALLVAGIEPDDEVLIPSLTFIAPANAIRYVGAWPVFIDSEPQSWQLDPQKLDDFVRSGCQWQDGSLRNRGTGRRIKGILPVHILGHPVDMDPIVDLARKYDLVVVEDATESLGAKYRGEAVGHLGDIACFSFNGNKIITTGGGGMLVTDDEAWSDRAAYLATQAKNDPIEYVHNEVGYNYRLSNIQAAMGVAQMEKLDEYIVAKTSIHQRYREGLSGVPGIGFLEEAPWAEPVYWLSNILVDADKYGIDRGELMRRLGSMNIQARPLWHPLHSLEPFSACMAVDIEVATRLHRDALSLPSSVGLTPSDQDEVIGAILEIHTT